MPPRVEVVLVHRVGYRNVVGFTMWLSWYPLLPYESKPLKNIAIARLLDQWTGCGGQKRRGVVLESLAHDRKLYHRAFLRELLGGLHPLSGVYHQWGPEWEGGGGGE